MSTTQQSNLRVALVTGAGQGIGRGIALRLASDGFNIAVNDVEQNKEAVLGVLKEISDATGQRCIAVYADVTKEEDVKRMIDTVVQELGSLDVLVANAGIAIMQPLLDLTVEAWDRTLAVNSRGVMLCYKHAAKAMIAQGRGGRIIGACSIWGKAGTASGGAYCASKFAVRGLSQSAAIELAPYGINVNCYAPGPIDTSLLDDIAKSLMKEGQGKEEYNKKRAESIPMGRIGTPDDVTGVVSFLAGNDSKFVTGQAVIVDGGVHFD